MTGRTASVPRGVGRRRRDRRPFLAATLGSALSTLLLVLLLGAAGRTLFLGPTAELLPALERATGAAQPPLLRQL